MIRLALVLALALAIGPAVAFEIHYAPAENLERIDVRQLDDAERTIDMAAYVLTDHAILDALREAAERGVVVRIDRSREPNPDRYPPSEPYRRLVATQGVTIRTKRSSVFMHLKSYAIDGRLLRAGAANFTPSGLKQQDNDLILTDDPAAVARFEADFARIWEQGE